jgi:hypothetical protein
MLERVSGTLLCALAMAGCAVLHTSEVTDLSRAPDGVRIYAPRVFLLVDAVKAKSTILVAPNFRRAYDVKPITVFAKQEVTLELDEGMLKKLSASQDTTAFLTFVKGAAEVATKAAGLPVSQNTVDGSFGLPSGVYEFTDDGKLVAVPGPSARP